MNKKINSLLIEILVVVLFFSLACVVLIRVFAGAAHISTRAGDRNSALLEAQNLAEQIYCAGDVADFLEHGIFKNDEPDCFTYNEENGCWEKTAAETDRVFFRYTALSQPDAAEGGLREGCLEAFSVQNLDTPLFALDCSRYIPGKAVAQ